MEIEIKDNSPKVKEELDKAVLRALVKCGETAEGYAKPLAPVDTGLLHNSITWAISGNAPAIKDYTADKPDKKGEVKTGKYEGTVPSDSGDKLSVYIGSNVEYAAIQELGSSKKERVARPFLKPAVADHAEKYREIIKNALKG